MDQVGPTFIAIVTGVIGLAMVAVIVSQRAQTPTVINSAGSALASVIGAAVSPLGGSSNAGATNFGSTSNSIGGLTL
jgi:hypothetical protein